jgi:hypothetical protein
MVTAGVGIGGIGLMSPIGPMIDLETIERVPFG